MMTERSLNIYPMHAIRFKEAYSIILLKSYHVVFPRVYTEINISVNVGVVKGEL